MQLSKKKYKKEAPSRNGGQWDFSDCSAKGDFARNLFGWDMEKFQSNGGQVYVWRNSNITWTVAKFFAFCQKNI